MSLPSVRETRILNAQQIDISDIDSVCARPCAGAVPVKVAVADRDRRSRHTTHDTVLVVDKLDTVDCQIALVQADTRSVHVGHTGTCQGQVPHRRVVALYDKKPFSYASLVGDDNARAGALDHEVVRVPHRAVKILPWLDFYLIAILGDRRRRRRGLVSLAWPDLKRRATSGARGDNARQYQHRKRRFRYGHSDDPSDPRMASAPCLEDPG